MGSDKGWLQAQMRSANQEVSKWDGWKKETIRKEISGRLSKEVRTASVVIRSVHTGRFVTSDRKK
jgi:hypothetical protein